MNAIDEMRETTSLIPVADASRSLNRSWWRNIGMLFARSRAEISAGNAVQYLGDNVERARGHWREALSSLSELQRLHGDNEVVAELAAQLPKAGVNDVLREVGARCNPAPRPQSRGAPRRGRRHDSQLRAPRGRCP